jgi:hypoxanthine phosphoribosyltransferase
MKSKNLQSHFSSILLKKQEIEKRISEIAEQVDAEMGGENLIVVGVLNGGVNTTCKLADFLQSNVKMAWIELSSYSGTKSTGKVHLLKDIDKEISLKDKNVLVVDDISDTNRTLKFLKEHLDGKGARKIEFFTLLSKKDVEKVEEIDVKYIGFEIPNQFVVGFGLDYDDRYRNLEDIAILDPSVYAKRQKDE